MNDKTNENTKTAQAIKEKAGAVLAANKKAREEQTAKQESLAESKPTPTQEENDPQRHGETHTRHLDPRKPAPQGGYQTRTAQPAKPE
jgi:hypothetical protein